MENNFQAIYIIGTDKCNLKCEYCANDITRKPKLFNPDKILSSIDNIKEKNGKNCKYSISISGGEPLIDMDFNKLIMSKFEKDKLTFKVYTNGILLNDKINDEINKHSNLACYLIGIDGSKEKNIKNLITNQTIISLGQEDKIRFVYVIDSMDSIKYLYDDINILIQNGFNKKTIVVFNYEANNKYNVIKELCKEVKYIISKTEFIPAIGSQNMTCNQITIERDGTYLNSCDDMVEEKYLEFYQAYQQNICISCKNKIYCPHCFRNVVDRFGIQNHCNWIDAICANIK